MELLDRFGRAGRRGSAAAKPLTVRLWYAASEPVARPVFSVSVQTLQGVVISGPTTREPGEVPEKLDGERLGGAAPRPVPAPARHVRPDRLAHGLHLAHPYDVRRNVLRMDVDRKGPVEPAGVVSLGGTWSFGP